MGATAIRALLSPAVLVIASVLALAVATGVATRIGLLIEDLTARGNPAAGAPTGPAATLLPRFFSSQNDSDLLRKESKVKRFTVPRVAHCSEGCATTS